MGTLSASIVAVIVSLVFHCGTVYGDGGGVNGIPAKVHRDHWACKEISELCEKYGAEKKLSSGDLLERKELAPPLIALMDKVLEKQIREGRDAVPREDLELIAVLHDELKAELALDDGYLTRREAIERMLAKTEVSPFEYKVGVGGFLRGEGAGNLRLTDSSHEPGLGEGRFLYRVKPYVYWHPTDYLDIHGEGQGYGFSGGSHQEYNKFSLYQGFVEARLPGGEWFALKAGRQEFAYGSAFILGSDTFFDGLAFDAARFRVKPAEPVTIDLLLGSYAPPFSGGIKGNLVGSYLTWRFSEGNAVEIYALRDSGSTDHHSGEHLHVWGSRGTVKAGPVAVEFEPVYETGRIFNGAKGTNDRMDAFGAHLDLTFDADLAGYVNKLFLSIAYGSGSRKAANGGGTGGEFRNPLNDSSLLGDMGLIGDLSGITIRGANAAHRASGLQIYTLGWGMDISTKFNFSATGHYFRANHTEDGFSRHLGLETDFTLAYNVTDGLSCIIGYDHFFTGAFFRSASGNDGDIDYGYLMMQFDISGSKPRGK